MSMKLIITGLVSTVLFAGLAGCEGEQGPAGPQGETGPQGQDGLDGGLVAVHVIDRFAETPVPSNSETILLDIQLQPDEFIRYSAWASVAVGTHEGLVELPLLVQKSDGQAAQAVAMLGYSMEQERFTMHLEGLWGFYVTIAVDVMKAGSSAAARLVDSP